MPLAQKNIHVIFETLAVFILAPYLIYLAETGVITRIHKIILYVIAVLTIVIDGYLLSKTGEWK